MLPFSVSFAYLGCLMVKLEAFFGFDDTIADSSETEICSRIVVHRNRPWFMY